MQRVKASPWSVSIVWRLQTKAATQIQVDWASTEEFLHLCWRKTSIKQAEETVCIDAVCLITEETRARKESRWAGHWKSKEFGEAEKLPKVLVILQTHNYPNAKEASGRVYRYQSVAAEPRFRFSAGRGFRCSVRQRHAAPSLPTS